jgi:hypothetical protein
VLSPGGEAFFDFVDFRPVTDWADAWDRRHEAPESSKLHLEVVVHDTFDDGIVDNIHVEVQGYPLRPVPDQGSTWTLWSPGTDDMSPPGAAVYPTVRRYWSSKLSNELLGRD